MPTYDRNSRDLWANFRDRDGRPHLDVRTLTNERSLLEAALAAGQAEGDLTTFSPRVMAVTLKAALDGLLAQLALEPELDLDAYAAELVSLFQRATTGPTQAKSQHRRRQKTTQQTEQREETD